MKKLLTNLKNTILRHKILSIICILAFAIILILLYMFCSIFVGGNDKYGDRLKGIKEVEFTKSELKEIQTKTEEYGEVESAKVRLQGKIIYFDIIYKQDVNKDKAKEIATKTLENFDDNDKKFYDFEYILTQQSSNEENQGFKITGTKSPKIDNISWIKS